MLLPLMIRMSRSTLFILVKYMVFLNWTLTGVWIIYNSSDYSKNAQIISEKISRSLNEDVSKQSVVYGLIVYTIVISSLTFFGLVGVCYENFSIILRLAFSYLIYIIFDITTNALIGVPFNLFMILLQFMLILTCLNLFYLSWLIHFHVEEEEEHQQLNVFRDISVRTDPCLEEDMGGQGFVGKPSSFRQHGHQIDYHQSDHHQRDRHDHQLHYHPSTASSSHAFSSRVDFYDNTDNVTASSQPHPVFESNIALTQR